MKKNSLILITVLLFSIILGGCQATPADQAPEDSTELSQASKIETAYPAEEETTAQESTVIDAAYPITEADLEHLLQIWETTLYTEDGIVQDPAVKSLQFNADGTYELTSPNETISGEWTARLSTLESLIILTDSSGDSQTYEIIELEENQLILQSWRETILIEQQFEIAD